MGGNWVEFKIHKKRYIGYVIELKNDGSAIIQVTYPDKDWGVIKLPFEKCLKASDLINKDDILQLINIALDTKDEEWFMELTNKLRNMF